MGKHLFMPMKNYSVNTMSWSVGKVPIARFFLPVVTARYVAVTAATAGVR
jgi:hypothetical protein